MEVREEALQLLGKAGEVFFIRILVYLVIYLRMLAYLLMYLRILASSVIYVFFFVYWYTW